MPESRSEKALRIARSGEITLDPTARTYRVPSDGSPGRIYRVTLSDTDAPSCQCPSALYGPCKHQLACLLLEQAAATRATLQARRAAREDEFSVRRELLDDGEVTG